jgi:hypothetical protein
MTSTSFGVTFDLGGGTIEVLSPVGYQAWFGATVEPDPRRFLGCRIGVANLGETGKALDHGGVPHDDRMGAIVVPPSAANGVSIAFVDETDFRL